VLGRFVVFQHARDPVEHILRESDLVDEAHRTDMGQANFTPAEV
jgi:hypothetical protein